MQAIKYFFGLVLLIIVANTSVTSGSDRAAVYARVDRVVLEPSADAAQRVQVWGVFAMANPGDPNGYPPPARGYLYFAVAANPAAARQEWADLQSVAGTNQIVSFGSRWELKTHVRRADEKPADPDAYPIG